MDSYFISQKPDYKKAYILLFSSKYLNEGFMDVICNEIGDCSFGEFKYDGRCIGVNVPGKKEEIYGQKFIDRYPEFFDSYEMQDLRIDKSFKVVENIQNDIETLTDFFSKTNNKIVDKKEYNMYLDNFINIFKSMKYD
jgi:hypothetical protein